MNSLLDQVTKVYESDSVIVVNKPAGLIVHGDGRSDESNLCDWIVRNYPDVEGVGEPITRDGKPNIERPGIVHRLDRETSGVVIIARTDTAFACIKRQFKDRDIDKQYDVFVHGKVPEKEFSVQKPIGRSKGDFRRFQVPPHTRGNTKDAHTDFTRAIATPEASYLQAYPKTGRTHQIRVHLHSIHHPVVCDPLYATDKECLWGLDRQALHARRITFRLPDGSRVSAEAQLPDGLQRAKRELQQ